MVKGNPTLIFFWVLGIHLLLGCFLSTSSVMHNKTNEATTNIESDVQSISRTARQYVVPAIGSYSTGLLMNYQQQTPSNTFHSSFYGPSNIPTVSDSSDKNIPITNPDTSAMEFDEILLSTRQQQQYPCGRGPAALPQRATVGIVGGSEAVKNSWPFIVALRYDGFVSCGGSLISSNKVLTAAHCVEQKTSAEISTLTVSLGMHTVGDPKLGTSNDAQMTRRVSRVIMHNGYNTLNQINDIAILILESPVVYSDAISPVCLAPASTNPDQYADKDVAIVGWGRIASVLPDIKFPDALQQAAIKVIRNAKCKEQFAVTKNSLCVQTITKGTCKGDSGGPVIIRSANGAWTQVGIVSYGHPTCASFFPNVLTRVSAYRSWIDHYM